MKKALFALLLTMAAVVSAWSQPKVAVLDAVIPQNMDPSVISPATDKIIEKLVQSNRFTVLDRANIESVLKEREFQVSGMVSDQDVVTAGKYLGADFVVVVKISKVGDTNFISGKMINVKTGVIVSTTSAQGEGKLAVLIGLAGQVGEALSGGSAAPEPKVATPPPEEPRVVAPPPEEPVAVAPPPQETKPVQPTARFTGGQPAETFIGLGFFFNGDTWKEKDETGSYSYTETRKLNLLTLNMQIIAVKYMQLGIGFSWFTSGTREWDNTSPLNLGSSDGPKDYYKDYTMSWLDLNWMLRLPIKLGSSMALVPMAGVEYDINMSLKDADGNDLKSSLPDDAKSDLNHFYFQIGGGLQIDIGNVVLYPEFIYGFKIKSTVDTDRETYQKTTGNWSTSEVSEGKMDIGLVVGFKIN
jgi:hypothetical protein